MSKTRAQVITQSAKFNKLTDVAGTFEAADQTALDAYFDPVVAQLRVDGICDVDDEDAIPDEWFLPLSWLVANAAGPEWGIEYNPQKKLVVEAELKKTTASRPTYETLAGTYY